MKALRWSPDTVISNNTDCEDKEVQCYIKKNKQWYKRSISIPLWALSTAIVGTVSTISFIHCRKRD